MKLIPILAALAITLPLSAYAADPAPAAVHTEPVVLAEMSSIEHNQVAARMRVLESFPTTRTIGDDAYPHQSRAVTYVFNCVEQTYAIAQWTLFDGQMGQGRTVWKGNVAYPSFVTVDRTDAEAHLLAAACSTTVVTDNAPTSLRAN